MMQKIFKWITNALLLFSILNGAYLALPADIQLQYFSWYSQAYAAVNAAWAGLTGLGGGALLAYVARAQADSDDRYLTLKGDYNVVADELRALRGGYNNVEVAINNLTEATSENNKLQKINLEAKLTNPMIKEHVEKLIEEATEYDEKE